MKNRFLLLLLLTSPMLFGRKSFHIPENNPPKINLAQKQYLQALDRVLEDTPRFMKCLKDPQCDYNSLQQLKRSISRNLGTMQAALTSISSSFESKK